MDRGHNFHVFKTFIAITLSVLLFGSAQATCIVIIKARDRIIVAADSMRGFISQNTGKVERRETVCKIIQVGDGLFASAGIGDISGSFDPRLIAKQIMSTQDTPSEKARKLDGLIVLKLKDEMKMLRTTEPLIFQQACEQDLSTAFFGHDKGGVYLYIRKFDIQPFGQVDVAVKIVTAFNCPSQQCRGYERLALGESKIVEAKWNRLPSKYALLPKAVSSLVESQIVVSPDKVGPPVDVVEVTQSSIKWINKKKECN